MIGMTSGLANRDMGQMGVFRIRLFMVFRNIFATLCHLTQAFLHDRTTTVW